MKENIFYLTITTLLLFGNTASIKARSIKNNFPISNLSAVNNKAGHLSIEGYYISKPMGGEMESCDLSVKITKAQGQYFYTFHIDGKVRRGKIRWTKADDPHELGITFAGIKWAQNDGDISGAGKSIHLKLPNGIEGIWSQSGIMIQNYGNSMNDYIQIASCGQKYINLVKQ